MMYIGIICFIILAIFAYITFLTPYPFVWLLRCQKDGVVDKSPENIVDIHTRVTSLKDIPYPSHYPNATFDLYFAKDVVAKSVVIWIHGGSFISGTSHGLRNFGPMLADQECIVCAMNYAYAPRYSFPTQLQQVDELCEYLTSYIEKTCGYIPKTIILGGDSAGANIAASYITMEKDVSLAAKAKLDLKKTFTIKGALLFCGPYDFCEDLNKPEWKQFKKFFKFIGWSYLGKKHFWKHQEMRLASPIHHIHDNFPTTYICDGKKFSFLWQGKKLVQILQEQGIHVTSRFYEDMPHEFQFDYVKYQEEAMQVFEDTCACIQSIHAQEKGSEAC